MATYQSLGEIIDFHKTKTHFQIQYATTELATLHILNDHVFKFHMSPRGNFLEYPKPINVHDGVKINVKKITDYDAEPFKSSVLKETDQFYTIYTNQIKIKFNKQRATMSVTDCPSKKVVLEEAQSLSYSGNTTKQTLSQNIDEYFYGGGMQNGRFSHKGEDIDIINANYWTDGGVSSPCPFYWSTYGYGVLRNTWQQGNYDFGSKNINIVETVHDDEDFDAFFFIRFNPEDILNDYYELTGQPMFMPEYAFYEAHIEAFNRDYWVKVASGTEGAILFEDGLYYKFYKSKDMNNRKGVLVSLNGETNYQFSARAMIDRYKRHDIPLAWIIPNDGIECGYGQTDTFEGDIENLKSFVEYAREHGVECALWADSTVEPADPHRPQKGDRDLRKEVCTAGIVGLKCHAEESYSLGLSVVKFVSEILSLYANRSARAMVITVNGWAGTQRHAGIWSGNQWGGEWKNIQFHIPSYIGSGLSGIPNVGSDIDGICGGGNKEVNIRDYQWKSFTPLQLNINGWSDKQKTPFAYDDEAIIIIREYLKLKAMLMPYNYSIGHESIHGLPMVRAMFLDFPNENCGYTKDSQYQYMWGPYILVAPVYKDQDEDKNEWVRHGIYLPNIDQVWVDLWTGEKYQGGKIWNNLKTPLWKIPVFVKDGAIIPITNPNNNPNEIKRDVRIFTIYPNGESNFIVYEDDGISTEYLKELYATTEIEVTGPKSNESGNVNVYIHKTNGNYKCMEKRRITILKVMATKSVENIKTTLNDQNVTMNRVNTEEEFNNNKSAYYYDPNYVVTPNISEISGDITKQSCLIIKICKTDVTQSDIQVEVSDFENKRFVCGSNTSRNALLKIPNRFSAFHKYITFTNITVRWQPLENVYYEIERDGTLFTNITGDKFTFEGFKPNYCEHKFKIRSANDDGVSDWSHRVIVSTKDPKDYKVKVVNVDCNIESEPSYNLEYLIDDNPDTYWHTDWNRPGQANPKEDKEITLTFDLGGVYTIETIEYTPRSDAGNGTILELQYTYSIDGNTWNPLSDIITWEHNKYAKTISIQSGEMRYILIKILDSVEGFGSGKHMRFYKTIN